MKMKLQKSTENKEGGMLSLGEAAYPVQKYEYGIELLIIIPLFCLCC